MLHHELSGLSSVLNLGSGGYSDFSNRPDFWQYLNNYKLKVAVDALLSRVEEWYQTDWIPVHMRVNGRHTLPFSDNTFDVVIGTDFLEHLHYDEVEHVVEQSERVSSKYVIWFTPVGFLDTEEYQGQHITSDYDIHYCGLEPEFFTERNYSVEVIKNMHNFGDKHFDAIWAWKKV